MTRNKIRNLKMNEALSDESANKKKVSASRCKLSSLTNFDDCKLLSLKKFFLFDSKILTSVLFGFHCRNRLGQKNSDSQN